MGTLLLTINTWKCDGDYYGRMQALAGGLEAIRAQVVLCQECFSTVDGTVDTLDWLSAALGMSAYFVPARRKMRLLGSEWVDSFSGLGILSRQPVVEAGFIDLPSSGPDGGRRAQLATLEIMPGRSLLVANIHLTHLHDENLRRQQLNAVLEEMGKSAAPYRIIGGDWNTPVGSEVMQELTAQTGAEDSYVLAGGKEPRVSLLAAFHHGRFLCVDHIFSMPIAGRNTYPLFTDAAVVLNGPDSSNGLYPSDHFGLKVTLVPD
jgi:endonuclease/exonuclease/phosphatase family metal-dependent hydrolase